MLPKSQRLTTKLFDEVMKKGRVTHSSLFVLRYMQNTGNTKISAVIPVKFAKIASKRISLRRRIYTALEKMFIQVKLGSNVIIFTKTSSLPEKSADLTSSLKEIFVKAGLIM